MTGVPRHIAEHRLNIREGCPPVRQKRRSQAADRNRAIQEEVEKLVDAGIMKEVHYHSWLSNPVMVKKHDGSWRMCIDFKDLNKACPKDGYPLPEIDWKDFLEAKYIDEDAPSKKFLVSNFTNYKMTDSRPVLEQYNELLGILGRFTQHKMNMDEAIQESLRAQNSDKPKGNNVAGPSIVNMVEHNNSSRECKGVNVGNKANGLGTEGSMDGSSNSLKGQNIFNKSLHVYYVTYVSETYFVLDDDVAWW
ncbi:hypothetical protein Tco_0688876, partial [Tanacetum coccineum]